jgi:lysophospholipase L1-like esterase
LGRGYPFLLAGALLADYPDLELQVYNRGISGNKVPDLLARWEEDALELDPSILSILIGVNDIWHKLNGRYDGTVDDFESQYRVLLQNTGERLPKVQILLCEPFVLRCGAVNERWFPEFDLRRGVVMELAREFDLQVVPFQSMFDEAVKSADPEYWAADGVHPTLAGHALMAEAWRKAAGL